MSASTFQITRQNKNKNMEILLSSTIPVVFSGFEAKYLQTLEGEAA